MCVITQNQYPIEILGVETGFAITKLIILEPNVVRVVLRGRW